MVDIVDVDKFSFNGEDGAIYTILIRGRNKRVARARARAKMITRFPVNALEIEVLGVREIGEAGRIADEFEVDVFVPFDGLPPEIGPFKKNPQHR